MRWWKRRKPNAKSTFRPLPESFVEDMNVPDPPFRVECVVVHPPAPESVDSPRWCETCGRYTDHHTDRHPQNVEEPK